MDELESILRRAQTSTLDEKGCAKIKAVFESYLYLTNLVEDKATAAYGAGPAQERRADRAGFIFDQELRTLRRQFEAPRSS